MRRERAILVHDAFLRCLSRHLSCSLPNPLPPLQIATRRSEVPGSRRRPVAESSRFDATVIEQRRPDLHILLQRTLRMAPDQPNLSLCGEMDERTPAILTHARHFFSTTVSVSPPVTRSSLLLSLRPKLRHVDQRLQRVGALEIIVPHRPLLRRFVLLFCALLLLLRLRPPQRPYIARRHQSF